MSLRHTGSTSNNNVQHKNKTRIDLLTHAHTTRSAAEREIKSTVILTVHLYGINSLASECWYINICCETRRDATRGVFSACARTRLQFGSLRAHAPVTRTHARTHTRTLTNSPLRTACACAGARRAPRAQRSAHISQRTTRTRTRTRPRRGTAPGHQNIYQKTASIERRLHRRRLVLVCARLLASTKPTSRTRSRTRTRILATVTRARGV